MHQNLDSIWRAEEISVVNISISFEWIVCRSQNVLSDGHLHGNWSEILAYSFNSHFTSDWLGSTWSQTIIQYPIMIRKLQTPAPHLSMFIAITQRKAGFSIICHPGRCFLTLMCLSLVDKRLNESAIVAADNSIFQATRFFTPLIARYTSYYPKCWKANGNMLTIVSLLHEKTSNGACNSLYFTTKKQTSTFISSWKTMQI